MKKAGKICHEEFVELWNQKVSIGKLAKKFGVSQAYVSHYSKRHRDECPERRPRIPGSVSKGKINLEEFAELWNKGVHAKVIAKKFDVSAVYVYKFAERHREYCPARKIFKPNRVEEFATVWNSGLAVKEIGKLFDISEHAVCQYASNHRDVCLMRKSPLDEEKIDLEEFAELWNNWEDTEKIANKFGISTKAVYKYAKVHSDVCMQRIGRPRVDKRENFSVLEFAKMWNAYIPAKEIAEKFKLSVSAVYRYGAKHRDVCPKRKIAKKAAGV